MEQRQLAIGDVINDPDLAEWQIVGGNWPIEVVWEFVSRVTPGAPLGPDGKPFHNPLLRYWSEFARPLDSFWRDGAAVVMLTDPGEVHAIVRHGECFRLVRLRTAQ